jgi:hypothetical protein
LHGSVARLPRWVDFSFPKEYLSHYDHPINEKYISVKTDKKSKRKYYVDDSSSDSYESPDYDSEGKTQPKIL